MSHTVFLTGFPGFLGSALAGRLLDRYDPDVTLTALVQPRYRALAETRVREIEASGNGRRGRLLLVEGDITKDGLGLDAAYYAALQAHTHEMYHLAAVYDLGVARNVAMRINVHGTRHMLAFAAGVPSLRRFQYVSTCYVSGRTPGAFLETDLVRGQAFNNHYEQTKYLAELEVQKAMHSGLPTTIYRPSVVVGDSRTGATQKYDGPYALVKWMLRWKRLVPVPILGDPTMHSLNVVPQDFVVNAIDVLSTRDASEGQVYQLADPAPLSIDQMVRVLGHVTQKHPVKLRLPLALARGALRYVPGLATWTEFDPESLAYFSHPTTYDTAMTTRDLADSGVSCPAFASYADRLADFVRAHPDVTAAAMV